MLINVTKNSLYVIFRQIPFNVCQMFFSHQEALTELETIKVDEI